MVIRVNGKRTRTKAEFYSSLFGVSSGDDLRLQVYRPSEGTPRNSLATAYPAQCGTLMRSYVRVKTPVANLWATSVPRAISVTAVV